MEQLNGNGSLLELIEDASQSINNLAKEKEQSKWRTGTELMQAGIESIPCLVEPLIPKTGIAIFGGSSDTGKSTFLRLLVIAIVSGADSFLGWKLCTTYKRALFIATEDDENAIKYLIKKQAANCPPDKLKELYYLFDYDPATLVDECKKFAEQKPVDLIVVDCFSDAFGGKLMDTNDVRRYLNLYKPLSENCTVIFLHHTGKRTENYEPNKNNLLSGQGLEAKARLVIELRLDHINPRLRHLCITKGNYLSSSFKRESFELDFDENNFTFTNTGRRIPFEDLVREQNDEGKSKYLQASELRAQGKSFEEIAPLVGYTGKGSVSKLFKKAKQKGWDKSNIDSVSSEETEETKEETPI
jgi:RecA-family ATPase